MGTPCAVGINRPSFGLVDLTGDAKPDLVVTSECGDSSAGTDHWRIFVNTGSSFASSPTRFALPSGYSTDTTHEPPFEGLGGVGTPCAVGINRPSFGLVDLTGDKRPDLVVTAECNDTTAGTDHWRLFALTCGP